LGDRTFIGFKASAAHCIESASHRLWQLTAAEEALPTKPKRLAIVAVNTNSDTSPEVVEYRILLTARAATAGQEVVAEVRPPAVVTEFLLAHSS